MVMHIDSLGIKADNPMALSAPALAAELDRLAEQLPDQAAALVREAAARIRELPDD
ncbi:hypothetical protein ACL00X_11065 [Aeromonas diversa]|uniref:hypothetical protein n=1 Tax=Aeromonas diversa TaxID=502790 RepID=UPI0039A35670